MPARIRRLMAVAACVAAMSVSAAQAQKKYDPGASDGEIRIGNIMPYSGPASSYGVIGSALLLIDGRVLGFIRRPLAAS